MAATAKKIRNAFDDNTTSSDRDQQIHIAPKPVNALRRVPSSRSPPSTDGIAQANTAIGA